LLKKKGKTIAKNSRREREEKLVEKNEVSTCIKEPALPVFFRNKKGGGRIQSQKARLTLSE